MDMGGLCFWVSWPGTYMAFDYSRFGIYRGWVAALRSEMERAQSSKLGQRVFFLVYDDMYFEE